MTTTILGANGKLGGILAHYAAAAQLGWRTQARHGPADILWSGSIDNPLSEAIFQRDATLINMIGYTGPDEEALFRCNVQFVEQLLEEAAQAEVAHVILASSAAVYGANDAPEIPETAPLQPLTPYGESKLAMERIATSFAARHSGPTVTILRIGNVAGADALSLAAQRHIDAGKVMSLHQFEDGSTPVRSYIGPRDLFEVFHNLPRPSDRIQTINVAHPQPLALEALLEAYRAHVMPQLEWQFAPVPKGIPQRVTLSTEKLQHIVKLKEYADPADAIGRQLGEYRAL